MFFWLFAYCMVTFFVLFAIILIYPNDFCLVQLYSAVWDETKDIFLNEN